MVTSGSTGNLSRGENEKSFLPRWRELAYNGRRIPASALTNEYTWFLNCVVEMMIRVLFFFFLLSIMQRKILGDGIIDYLLMKVDCKAVSL